VRRSTNPSRKPPGGNTDTDRREGEDGHDLQTGLSGWLHHKLSGYRPKENGADEESDRSHDSNR
jgi:hypothetical protein